MKVLSKEGKFYLDEEYIEIINPQFLHYVIGNDCYPEFHIPSNMDTAIYTSENGHRIAMLTPIK
jgi:hypothetical protein